MSESLSPKIIEIVPHSIDNLEAVQRFVHAQPYLDDPALRRDYFEHMNPTDFVDYLQRLSSLVVDGDGAYCRPFKTGDSLISIGLDGVNERDRETLVKETWGMAVSVLRDRSIDDENALMQAGIIARSGIIATHPFNDANGRTTRLLFFLMGYGGEDEETLRQILTKNDTHDMQFVPIIEQNIAFPKCEAKNPIQMIFRQTYPDGTTDLAPRDDAIIREFIERYPDDAAGIVGDCLVADQQGNEVLDVGLFRHMLAGHEKAQVYLRDLHEIEQGQRRRFAYEAVRSFLATDRSCPEILERYIDPNFSPRNPRDQYRHTLVIKAMQAGGGVGLTQLELYVLRHKMGSKAYERLGAEVDQTIAC